MNATPPKVVYLVIGIMGVIALLGIMSLCLTMFFKTYADPAVLTSIISITSGSMGSLGTMLVSTRSQPATKQEVLVANPPGDPVPVTEAKP